MVGKKVRSPCQGDPIRANYKVKAGDQLVIQVPEPESLDLEPEDIPFDDCVSRPRYLP